MLHEVVVDSPDRLAETLAARFEQEAERALAARGRFALALPGGSVARTFFPRLARVAVDWSHTDFFWGDERAVPPTDAESNYALARALWLEPAGVPDARIHRMKAEGADLAAAAATAEDEMAAVLGTPPRLDLVILGVGEDGHVCSLFPGHPLLSEARRFVAAIEDAPKPPPRRLTLTLPALATANLVVVAALGAGKARAMEDALDNPSSASPLARVLHTARASLVLLDPAAASQRGVSFQ